MKSCHYIAPSILTLALLIMSPLVSSVCYADNATKSVQQNINDATSAVDNVVNSVKESTGSVTRTIENVGSITTKKSKTAKQNEASNNPKQINSRCYSFNPASLNVSEFKNGWAVVDTANPNRAIVFAKNEMKADVEMAQQAIQQFGINEVCYSERFVYYLASGNAPQGVFPNEKCMQFDPQALIVEQRQIKSKENSEEVRSTIWLVVDGKKVAYSGGDSETAANNAMGLIKNYQFTSRCRAGFNYMRR